MKPKKRRTKKKDDLEATRLKYVGGNKDLDNAGIIQKGPKSIVVNNGKKIGE